ncbi:MAG: hypothetical protein J5720_06735 [Bacteroidaceae bacterium]|nr:hypothetical protein [Bacteroidaceae bacterium]
MKNKSSKETIVVDHDVVDAEPKPKKRKIKKSEKVMTQEPAKDTAEEIAKKLAEEDAVSMAVLDKVEQFGKTSAVLETIEPQNDDDDDDQSVRNAAFAKYDAMMEEDDDDDDDAPRPIKRQMPVSRSDSGASPSPRGRGAKNKRRETEEGEFVIDDDSASISSLTKGNVWASNVDEIYQMLIEGRRTEHWAENRVHYMNIIAPVFDVQFIDNTNKQLVASLEEANYKVFPYPKSHDDKKNSIAIRKHQIKKITDLTMENILHLSAAEVLKLIDENMGTGWKGLPLAIQDIIETAFYVDCSVLPEAAMHRVGGLIDRRKDDGYEVLEIARGTWIEAVFMKFKPRQEKRRFEVITDTSRKSIDDLDDDEDDDDDDEEDDLRDETDEDREEEDEDESLEDQTPQIEEFEELPDDDDEDE